MLEGSSELAPSLPCTSDASPTRVPKRSLCIHVHEVQLFFAIDPLHAICDLYKGWARHTVDNQTFTSSMAACSRTKHVLGKAAGGFRSGHRLSEEQQLFEQCVSSGNAHFL
jgi:hypothetical protein